MVIDDISEIQCEIFYYHHIVSVNDMIPINTTMFFFYFYSLLYVHFFAKLYYY